MDSANVEDCPEAIDAPMVERAINEYSNCRCDCGNHQALLSEGVLRGRRIDLNTAGCQARSSRFKKESASSVLFDTTSGAALGRDLI